MIPYKKNAQEKLLSRDGKDINQAKKPNYLLLLFFFLKNEIFASDQKKTKAEN